MTLCRVTKSDGGVQYLLLENVRSIGDVKQAPGEEAPVCLIRGADGLDVYAKGTADDVFSSLFPDEKASREHRASIMTEGDIERALLMDSERPFPTFSWEWIRRLVELVMERRAEADKTPVVPGPKVES